MSRLIRAELLKIRTVPVLWAAVAASLAITGVILALQVVNAGRAGTPTLGTAQSAVNVLAASGWSALAALVMGIVTVTADFRHQTIATTLLVTPRRRSVVAAKLVAATLGALLIAAATLLLCAAVGLATGALTVATTNGAVLATVVGVFLTIPLYAVLGAGVGAVVTNQTIAVTGALLWFLVAESLLGSFGLRWLQRWTPAGATSGIAMDASMVGALPPWAGVLVLLAYGTALAIVGSWRIARRDVA